MCMSDEAGDKFEEEIIKQLMELFSGMNLPMDEKVFTGMVKDMIKQFDVMGIDPEKFNTNDVNFNIDISSIKDAISGGADIAEMFNNLGFRVEQRPMKRKVKIEVDENEEVEGIQEIHWVRATPVSVLTFAIVDTKENFETISIKANQWREKFAFDIHDMLVFDGDLIESVRR